MGTLLRLPNRLSQTGKIGMMAQAAYTWTVRAHSHQGAIRVQAGRRASFSSDPPLLSALDCLLGALAADLVNTLSDCARRDRVNLDQLECRLSGRLNDQLADGSAASPDRTPALSSVWGTLYVSAADDKEGVRRVWQHALRRSPLFTTLDRCTAVSLELQFEA
jgi:hypothetical protein